MYARQQMRRLAFFVLAIVLTGAVAHAQPVRPIPPVVVDLRGFYSGLGQDPVTAAGLALQPEDLPGRGLGGIVGVHVYPLRRVGFAFGLGGEAVLARGEAVRVDADGVEVGPPVGQRLRSLSGQLSLNFGRRNGWSYLSAGIGPTSFATFLGSEPPDEPAPRRSTINMGGGARWFSTSHVAFAFDVRFHLTRPEPSTPDYPARQRTRLLILSAGISLR